MKTIESPCIHVCKIRPHGTCQGCGRTSREISNWLKYTDDEREGIMARNEYWNDPNVAYNKEHDAYYYKDTKEWIESQCADPNCLFCKDRPEKAP